MTAPDRKEPKVDEWFRVEVTDGAGQVVAIESEMLAGRDIGELETATINRAIDHLSGFIGRNTQAPALAAEVEALKGEVARVRKVAQLAERVLVRAAHAARENDYFESALEYSNTAGKLRAALARAEGDA